MKVISTALPVKVSGAALSLKQLFAQSTATFYFIGSSHPSVCGGQFLYLLLLSFNSTLNCGGYLTVNANAEGPCLGEFIVTKQ